ncbi:MAG TPA: DUF3450 family protein [Wenzhouxiangella sp.]|nr:DUF3450 family protein [Wenzhouxiangella sp.]
MTRIVHPGLIVAAMVMASSLAAQPVPDNDDLEVLAQELVRLRGEVEELNARLNQAQDRHRGEMNSLALQKGDQEATVRRERLRVEQLEADLARNRERAQQAGIAGEALLPIAETAIDDLKSHVATSLPFKTGERLQAIEEIETRIAAGALSPARAINQIWRFYEDELRLTRENGLHSQIIELDGERMLADVARLGTVAMYFRTRDGEFGQVAQSGRQWRFERLEDRDAVRQVETLFDSLQKQIRTGYFELPNAAIRPES